MKIDILCTDPDHPVNSWLHQWQSSMTKDHHVSIMRHTAELAGGDILFLISCYEIVKSAHRDLYKNTFVIHASDLPKGRGMSPHIWQILKGENNICVTLLNAEDELDSGDIWHQVRLLLSGDELYEEINSKLFAAEIELMTWAVDNYSSSIPRKQTGIASYYMRRKPEDSKIDPTKSLADQFNLLRVCDPHRFPAFFEIHGKRYKIEISKMDE